MPCLARHTAADCGKPMPGRRRSPRTLSTTAAVRTAQGRVNSSGEAQRMLSRPGHTAAALWQTRTQAIAQPRSLSVRACRRSTRRRRLGCPCSLRAGRRCRTAARAGAQLQSQLGQSHLDQSHLGRSHLGQSHLGQSHLGQSHLGQSHLGQSHLGVAELQLGRELGCTV
jgi:hypothetical protein